MTAVDLELRELANEICEQLFPKAGPRGQPLPLPVEVEWCEMPVLFVPERIIRKRHVEDVRVSEVRVFVDGLSLGTLDLAPGVDPEVSGPVAPLLRAVTGIV